MPKAKESASKKVTPAVMRPPISESSLVYVPEDAVAGFQDRIEKDIDWTLIESGVRHHKELCNREEIPKVTFSQALQNKLNKSLLNGFLDEKSGLNLDQHWDFLLPVKIWDNDKFATDEGKACFHNANCVTDDLVKLIEKTVKAGNRKVLQKDIKMVNVLRVNDSQMTELDKGLYEFKKLVSLNLCGNYIDDLDTSVIPPTLKILELQANRIRNIGKFAETLPYDLIYLGLARNFLTSDTVIGVRNLPYNLTVLDLSDNDIYYLEPTLDAVANLPNLTALQLAGNPCSVCAGYARAIFSQLPRLKWLDCREIIPPDRHFEPAEFHPDDLRSTYFTLTVFRVMSVPQPPKAEKGAITSFHVEFEIPLLDVIRRKFLLYRHNESLIDMLPPPEDDEWQAGLVPSQPFSKTAIAGTPGPDTSINEESVESDIYSHLVMKNLREVHNFTTYESNRVQYSKVMSFQEPIVRIFCPDLTALRNTFRSTITIRLIYTVNTPAKIGKNDRKSTHVLKAPPGEMRVVIATIRCGLKALDWSQPQQHFHWDDSLGTSDAIHWGEGDLAIIQYSQGPLKSTKSKIDGVDGSRQYPPENLTCHIGIGIETL